MKIELRDGRRLAGGVLVVVILVVGLPAVGALHGDEPRTSADGQSGRIATVTRRTLVERESVDGTLGYSGARTVVNRLATGGGASGGGGSGSGGGGGGGGGGEPSSQGSGTVTRLARQGSVVGRGGTLYEIDNRPVFLMYGRLPAYRRLSTRGTDGPDVRQLEQNLAALGFGAGVTIDEHFSAATAAAVRRWQRSLGLREDGAVELGRVVFQPGARRVGSHKTKVGSAVASGAEVLETTSTRRVVTVELEVSKQSLVRRGDSVTVALPDGSTVRGRITRVGRVARKKDAGGGSSDDGGTPGGGGSGDSELVIDLMIVLRGQRGVARLDQAPVTVGIAQETKRNALSVPVAALVARPGGGYGVEVVRGGRRRIVAVRTGLFAGGLVEVSGRGIGAGTKVAVPAD